MFLLAPRPIAITLFLSKYTDANSRNMAHTAEENARRERTSKRTP
jgi:hypothetical protein